MGDTADERADIERILDARRELERIEGRRWSGDVQDRLEMILEDLHSVRQWMETELDEGPPR